MCSHMYCHILPYVLSRFSIEVDYGKSRHFCGDPVCPDPVWKPARFWPGRPIRIPRPRLGWGTVSEPLRTPPPPHQATSRLTTKRMRNEVMCASVTLVSTWSYLLRCWGWGCSQEVSLSVDPSARLGAPRRRRRKSNCYVCVCICIYIYIYIIERETCIYIYIYIYIKHTHMCIYIYI